MAWNRAVVLVLTLSLASCTDTVERAPATTGAASAVAGQRDFAPAFLDADATYQAAVEDLRSSGREALGGGVEQLLTVYEGFTDQLEAAHGRFAALRVPAPLADAHARLVADLERAAAASRAVVRSAGEGDDAALGGQLTALADALSGVDRARDTISQRLATA